MHNSTPPRAQGEPMDWEEFYRECDREAASNSDDMTCPVPPNR